MCFFRVISSFSRCASSLWRRQPLHRGTSAAAYFGLSEQITAKIPRFMVIKQFSKNVGWFIVCWWQFWSSISASDDDNAAPLFENTSWFCRVFSSAKHTNVTIKHPPRAQTVQKYTFAKFLMVIGRYTSRGVAPPAAPRRVPGVRAPRAGRKSQRDPLSSGAEPGPVWERAGAGQQALWPGRGQRAAAPPVVLISAFWVKSTYFFEFILSGYIC